MEHRQIENGMYEHHTWLQPTPPEQTRKNKINRIIILTPEIFSTLNLLREEVTKAERDACTAIACDMCNWVWHLDCLTPHITAEQCANAAFFTCGEECTRECAEFLQ